MNDYIAKGMSGDDLEKELLSLIADYNKLTGNYLLVYSAAISKPIPGVSLSMDDYYVIADLLRDSKDGTLDVYIETPGGSGEAAEEIVKFLRSKYEDINYIVSGEAKSAGTLIVLSGNNIAMTVTGSLGPVDAQVVIGRGQISAHDYMEWVKTKQEEAVKQKRLSPFDATMIAQISPGELNGVSNALEFAQDLVVKWLPEYKFKDWKVTETKKTPVTEVMKKKRAREIAKALTDHSRWRSHGRSLKIQDLEDIGLKIDSIENDKKKCELVNKIQVVLRLLYTTTSTHKVFAIEGSKIFATAAMASIVSPFGQVPVQQPPDSAQANVPCPKCGTVHKIYAKLVNKPEVDTKMQKAGFKKLPKDAKLVCNCGFELDLTGLKNQIEANSGRKVVE